MQASSLSNIELAACKLLANGFDMGAVSFTTGMSVPELQGLSVDPLGKAEIAREAGKNAVDELTQASLWNKLEAYAVQDLISLYEENVDLSPMESMQIARVANSANRIRSRGTANGMDAPMQTDKVVTVNLPADMVDRLYAVASDVSLTEPKLVFDKTQDLGATEEQVTKALGISATEPHVTRDPRLDAIQVDFEDVTPG